MAAIAGVFLFHALRPFNADDWHVKNAEQSAELGIAMGVFWRNRVTRVLLGARAQPAGSVATDVGRIAAGEPPAALEARHG